MKSHEKSMLKDSVYRTRQLNIAALIEFNAETTHEPQIIHIHPQYKDTLHDKKNRRISFYCEKRNNRTNSY